MKYRFTKDFLGNREGEILGKIINSHEAQFKIEIMLHTGILEEVRTKEDWDMVVKKEREKELGYSGSVGCRKVQICFENDKHYAGGGFGNAGVLYTIVPGVGGIDLPHVTSKEDRTACVNSVEWPKVGDECWFIDDCGNTFMRDWTGDEEDVAMRNFTGVHHTYEEAEKARDDVREFIRTRNK